MTAESQEQIPMAVIRTITIPPGENTGWHYHPALVQAVVLSGTLTRVLQDGTVEITRPGEPLVELPQQVHIGYNHGSEPLVILANYQVAQGCPLAVPAPPPDVSAVPACRIGGAQRLSSA
ncbi:cupin domain-containing protein [Kitasatospora sp. NBC_01250]|uniref:cupin domain-containing protein n=1 Tax=unclassified Kitasatospora TaxID=2633591 RepID=UPI002E11768F|nr:MULTISPECIES: cupin domain-containing protein [unclassified Kitasatospora]WSJ69455.1 cupin domain-containing protein [Kitasatospora sp. NBC_01302]